MINNKRFPVWFIVDLKKQITEDMKAAMRSGDTRRRDAIRLLQAAIKQREVDERIELDDVAVVAVIEKMLKQRRDSIAQYEAAHRQDLADAEKYEMGVLQHLYAPGVERQRSGKRRRRSDFRCRRQRTAGHGTGYGDTQAQTCRARRYGESIGLGEKQAYHLIPAAYRCRIAAKAVTNIARIEVAGAYLLQQNSPALGQYCLIHYK